jgi:hypothetical protein
LDHTKGVIAWRIERLNKRTQAACDAQAAVEQIARDGVAMPLDAILYAGAQGM